MHARAAAATGDTVLALWLRRGFSCNLRKAVAAAPGLLKTAIPFARSFWHHCAARLPASHSTESGREDERATEPRYSRPTARTPTFFLSM